MYKNNKNSYIWAVGLWVFVFFFTLTFPKFSTMDILNILLLFFNTLVPFLFFCFFLIWTLDAHS